MFPAASTTASVFTRNLLDELLKLLTHWISDDEGRIPKLRDLLSDATLVTQFLQRAVAILAIGVTIPDEVKHREPSELKQQQQQGRANNKRGTVVAVHAHQLRRM